MIAQATCRPFEVDTWTIGVALHLTAQLMAAGDCAIQCNTISMFMADRAVDLQRVALEQVLSLQADLNISKRAVKRAGFCARELAACDCALPVALIAILAA